MEDFQLVINICGKFMYMQRTQSCKFHGQGHCVIQWHFHFHHLFTGRSYQTHSLFKDLLMNIKYFSYDRNVIVYFKS